MFTITPQNYLTPNQTDIHYTLSGHPEGPLVILLHGLGGSSETFAPFFRFIPSKFNVVSVDIEGFGKTPLNTTRPLSFPQYVSDLRHLITHLQEYPGYPNASPYNKIVLVGHSSGAIICLHYAAQYPSETAGLMLLGVGRSVRGIPPAQQRMRDLAATARQEGMDVVAETAVGTNFPAGLEGREDIKDRVRKAVAACDAEAYARTAENVASDEHLDPDYGVIRCPSMFVAGDGDMISPVQRSKDVSRLMGGVSEVEVVKSGHQMILQDLDGVKKALHRFLIVLGEAQ